MSTEGLLHVSHPEIAVQFVLAWISFLILKDFFLGCTDEGLLLLMQLPPLSRRPGFSRFVEATVSRCTLEGLTFVSTSFESSEPYSRCSTVGLEDSKQVIEVMGLCMFDLTIADGPPELSLLRPSDLFGTE